MAAENQTIERAFGVTNIKTHIPLKLDLDEHNYDAWREIFLTHCLTFDVSGHIDGTTLPNGDNDLSWKKRDGLVKLWIYGTLEPQLFKRCFKKDATSRQIWLGIENKFRNNKEARAIQLDNELRTTEIGDESIEDYSQKLKSISDLLANVDSPVSERTLVMYLLNGLNERFDNIINVIKHKDPFPSFDSAKSMLEMEENRLKKSVKVAAKHADHPSSSSALVASVDSHKAQKPIQYRQFNNRGNRRYNGNRFRGRYNNQRGNYQNWANNYWQGPYPQWSNQIPPWAQFTHGPNRGLLGSRPSTPQHSVNVAENSFQPTTDFSHAFNTMSLADPSNTDWYMDSGATAHLASSAGSSHPDTSSPQ